MGQRNEQAIQIELAKVRNLPLRAWLLEYKIDGWKNVALAATREGALSIADASRPDCDVAVSLLPALAIQYPELESGNEEDEAKIWEQRLVSANYRSS